MANDQTGEISHHSPNQQQERHGELETLKYEVERLRAIEAKVFKPSETAGNVTKDDTGTTPEGEHPAESSVSGHIAMDFESVLGEIEVVAKERPALALLVAFSVGVIVGQISSRR